ncbi:MAG: histidine phosphatase family protein [Nitrospirae bacterium]|nr:histidine phosphatase family protein [Nitrospirota bacterium]
MSTLTLVRHGQASWLDENYDRLSDVGEEQSRRLGLFWHERSMRFDRVFVGPRKRHLKTAELASAPSLQNGSPWPKAEVLPGLDEYDWETLTRQALPELVGRYDNVRSLVDDFQKSNGREEASKKFQLVFQEIMKLWVGGSFNWPGVERWDAFIERVRSSLDTMRKAASKGQKLVAFTSGGPISIALHCALGTDEKTTLSLAWVIRNSALTEFLFSGEHFTLSTFNALPHLDSSLWTYR